MTALEEIAPYPQNEDEVTAENLAKNLGVYAQLNHRRLLDLETSKDDQHEAVIQVVNLYGLVKLLRAFTASNPEAADAAARELWADWDAGDSLGEWLWEWLSEWRIDPELITP